MTFDLETMLGIAIIAFFAFVLWRGGSANPVGTGQIQKQVNTIGAEVKGIQQKLDGCAVTADIEGLKREMEQIKASCASSGEVIAVEGQIAALNTRISAMERLIERTDAGVTRIEGYFLQKGIHG